MNSYARHFGLGRLPAFDGRDLRFMMDAHIPPLTARLWRFWWADGWWGDQGMYPHCVGYSWTHLLEDGPFTRRPFGRLIGPIVDPGLIYREAQKIDEWPGEAYDGTSVRAGAKYLQGAGFIDMYTWAWDLDTCITALLTTGPVVIGSWWYTDMFWPNSRGHITATGSVAGGHAYVLNGVNKITRVVRIKNSWGRSWGRRGHAYISFSDLARLIREDGEACLPVEK